MNPDWLQQKTDVRYAPHSALNTYQVCLPRPPSPESLEKRLWIIYIHGGAWCDPDQDATTFNPAQEVLLQSQNIEQIAGFASINYRLAPHSIKIPDPDDPSRHAVHPDHIQDVLAALAHVQQTYLFGERYILVGHSCGATLAFQVAMDRQWRATNLSNKIVSPLAILAIEGIYDLPALVEHNREIPYYRTFVTSAFRSDEAVWRSVSPTSADLNASWPTGKLVVIAHSRDDELVEWQQADLILQSLQGQNFHDSGARKARVLELSGTHDLWRGGVEVARAVEFTLKELTSS
ncbi:alpha/beta-hydrolase [Dissoconium aciculare CBS 342.82]|uniref:Kynurenine formamidase n=1 Tax=Dissoconium aciculare CBS 342.82 TaxID=1314786 RepID=A0A6J3LZX5_9PEZI|nr:alpha/beta-hydrolase [Dissoconium aciculare CBS 342.82]KAF1821223.1 alpha/beta-hydrolase [Dissoconium aciculare CBS 342.82]